VKSRLLLDTGPLVGYLNKRDQHHGWAVSQWESLAPPFITCEAVLSEACFLLDAHGGTSDWVMDLLERGIVTVDFSLADHAVRVRALLRKYRSVPMSLADACLVRMSEINPGHEVLTTDSDFRRYRRDGRCIIPAIMPDEVSQRS